MSNLEVDVESLKRITSPHGCDGNHWAAVVKRITMTDFVPGVEFIKKELIGMIRQNELLMYRSHEVLHRFDYCPSCGVSLTLRFPRASDRLRSSYSWVVDAACQVYGVSVDEFLGECREERIVDARDAVAFVLRNRFDETFQNIGRLIRRDHSSVISSVNRFATRLKMYARYNGLYENLKKLVDEH